MLGRVHEASKRHLFCKFQISNSGRYQLFKGHGEQQRRNIGGARGYGLDGELHAVNW